MKTNLIQSSTPAAVLAALLAGTVVSYADFGAWQNEVSNVGTTPAAILFTPTSGSAPTQVDVGALSGDRSFEFIVNAGVGGVSSALLGTRGANGNQGLKFEQWSDSEQHGVTLFGVVDLYSTTKPKTGTDTQITFVSGTADTDLYVDGVFTYKFTGTTIALTGLQGLAGIYESGAGTYFDILDGTIKGFASYDSALGSDEILAHYQAFVVPEPSTLALLSVGALGAFAGLRRRR